MIELKIKMTEWAGSFGATLYDGDEPVRRGGGYDPYEALRDLVSRMEEYEYFREE